MSTERIGLPDQRVGYQVTIPQPFYDADGEPIDITTKGYTASAKAKDPKGNFITPTTTPRTTPDSERHIADIVITNTQMTTGGEGTWLLDPYLESEAVYVRGELASYTFEARAKETEA
jgi:hypothetical protein